MKAALVVNRVTPNTEANLSAILEMAGEAADAGAELVLFPEAALTGLINNGDPAHDLPLGQTIPGIVTDMLAALAHRKRIWVAIGLLEREDGRLYDSAVMFTPDGDIGLRYRRIHPMWHGRNADASVYCQGTELPRIETSLGTFAFLICGDLFDDELIHRVKCLEPDWLLFPFARCFDDGSYDQERWDKKEEPEYIKRIQLVGVTTLMTNYLADRNMQGGSFGGAMVVSNNGDVIDAFPLGKTGMLVVDLHTVSRKLP